MDKLEESDLMAKYLDNSRLRTSTLNGFFLFLHHLFLSSDHIDNEEISAIRFFEKKENEIFKGGFFPPQKTIFDSISFFPAINFLFFNLDFSISDCKHYKKEGTFQEYATSLKTRLFNEKIFDDFKWVIKKYNEIFKKNNYPTIVAITEKNINSEVTVLPIVAKTLSRQIIDVYSNIYKTLFENPDYGNHEINKIVGQSPIKYLFSRYQTPVPDNFWCGAQTACDQKLFNHFSLDDNIVYELYAYHLLLDDWEIKIKNVRSFEKELNDLTKEFQNRWNERKETQFPYYLAETTVDITVSEEQQKMFEQKLRDVTSDIFFYETLLAREYYRVMQNRNYKNLCQTETTYIESHSISIIKSMGSTDWFFISNEMVYNFHNIEAVVNGQINYVLTETFWHEKDSYSQQKIDIRHLITPIYTTDYGREQTTTINPVEPNVNPNSKKKKKCTIT
ncbi:hypothetical protein SNEBB_003898 [Seison nebaliae]|nr:hypothetical protein SNEBB_003898 [Seison nebaliae]